ncbi:hypothetical protein BGZ51_002543 [Haplosporangium sp. Z 767]|nr:hypothetical protein BGZ50_006070 [Haplosporangium sp. Z 11]KAF9185606.1 hypothetical protein BGZ51_002543 [Haplosporangium sp. Z 767]
MSEQQFKPHVLIVGAGLGGLTLAAILERAAIPYAIYERASSVKPLGSAMSLGPGVMPMMEQLGILDEILSKSKIMGDNRSWSEELQFRNVYDYRVIKEEFGYEAVIISRPALYEILLKLVPREKVHFNKRVLSYVETGDGVIIRTSDGKTHSGNILVGADGAHSGVRQSLYERLAKEKRLSRSDAQPLKFSSICLVGQTRPVDPALYPVVEEEFCRFDCIRPDSQPYFLVTFTTAEKTICWMAILILDKESSKVHDSFRNSEWGPEAAESMANDVRHFRTVCGENKTFGDLIDQTPKELISKVMLEEKFFETWFDGRTVLLGDGAVNAMQDAVVLANYISSLKANDEEAILELFKQYRDERAPHARAAVKTSANLTRLFGRTWFNALLRKLLLYIPKWLWLMTLSKARKCRPQISFLPPANDIGSQKPHYQPSLERTRPKDHSSVASAL